jgi:hypothetical protein
MNRKRIRKEKEIERNVKEKKTKGGEKEGI